MVWNAAGTFHTRLSATALTANRKFVFPDLDGTFVVASAGVVTVDRISASSIFASVLSASVGHINQLSASLIVATQINVNSLFVGSTLTVSGATVMVGAVAMASTLTVSGTAVVGNLTTPGRISASAGNIVNLLSVSSIAATGSMVLGGATAAAPYTVNGSIASTAGAAAKFINTLKVWVSFVGATAAIRNSFNVSAVSRFGSGSYSVSFTNPIATSACAMSSVNDGSGAVTDILTNQSLSCTLNCVDSFAAGAITDPSAVNIGWATGG